MKLQRNARSRTLALGALALTGVLALSACGSDSNTEDGEPGGKKTDAAAGASGDIKCEGSGNLLAAGSSAQKNAMDQWVKDFQAACSDITIDYNPAGSSAGRESFLGGQVTFAGSDAAMDEEEIAKSKEVCKTGQAVNLPMVGGPIALAYNLEGVDDLVLDGKTLAGIFKGEITKWDDEAIKKLNPDAELPSSKINAVHRSDGSGTSANFTEYLKESGDGVWTAEPASDWAEKSGSSAKGSDGVTTAVKQAPGSITYVELSYAKNAGLSTAKIDTGAGDPVEISTDTAAKAISTAEVVGTGGDLALKLDYATKEAGAYPISLVTYEIACNKGTAKDMLPALKSFLAYTASEDGQKSIEELGYLPLPTEITEKVQAEIQKLA